MPRQNGRLTPAEKAFAGAYAVTGDQKYSGAKAGYKSDVASWMALQRPGVQEEIRRAQTARLFQEALPLAVNTLCAIMADERQPAGARVQASKIVLDRTLGDPSQSTTKQPHELSPEELAKAIAEAKLAAAALENVAADRARPVIEHEPDPGPSVFD